MTDLERLKEMGLAKDCEHLKQTDQRDNTWCYDENDERVSGCPGILPDLPAVIARLEELETQNLAFAAGAVNGARDSQSRIKELEAERDAAIAGKQESNALLAEVQEFTGTHEDSWWGLAETLYGRLTTSNKCVASQGEELAALRSRIKELEAERDKSYRTQLSQPRIRDLEARLSTYEAVVEAARVAVATYRKEGPA